jgi:hypothetical protein
MQATDYYPAKGSEDGGVYTVAPHRMRHLYVVGDNTFKRSDYRVSQGKGILKIIAMKMKLSLCRNYSSLLDSRRIELKEYMRKLNIPREELGREVDRFYNGRFFPVGIRGVKLFNDPSVPVILTFMVKNAEKGDQLIEFGYDDFPEQFMYKRDEVIEYGLPPTSWTFFVLSLMIV